MLLTILFMATSALASPDPSHMWERQTVASTECTTTGVHIIVARATTEDPGIGSLLVPVVLGIQQFLPGSDVVGVDYPATAINYSGSVSIGVSNATKLIEEYISSCPDSKIVLLGYSQGAQVIGDTVCGTTSSGFVNTSGLASKYSSNIIAVVGMGDPAHVAGLQNIDYGTSTNNGLFPRTSDADCLQYANRTRSYCDSGDAYCDSGLYLEPHYEYIARYGVDAVGFVCQKAAAASVGHVTLVTSVSAIPTDSTTFTGFTKSTGFASGTGSTISAQSTTSTSTASAAATSSSTSIGSSTGRYSWFSLLFFTVVGSGAYALV